MTYIEMMQKHEKELEDVRDFAQYYTIKLKHHDELQTALQDMDFFKESVTILMNAVNYTENKDRDYAILYRLGFPLVNPDDYKHRTFEYFKISEEQKQVYKEISETFLNQ